MQAGCTLYFGYIILCGLCFKKQNCATSVQPRTMTHSQLCDFLAAVCTFLQPCLSVHYAVAVDTSLSLSADQLWKGYGGRQYPPSGSPKCFSMLPYALPLLAAYIPTKNHDRGWPKTRFSRSNRQCTSKPPPPNHHTHQKHLQQAAQSIQVQKPCSQQQEET